MKTEDVRDTFFKFFSAKGHSIVPSSSLVPTNDDTLLFTNAGMVQFKNIFLGREPSVSSQAVSCQRCLRAGGKHNDLENVGYTNRHHTFFEMLGNFSFSSYFKKEAITYAWEFITQTLGLPTDKLWVTIFHSDKESEQIWLKDIGLAPDRLVRLGEADNFWAMGDTGPCGPCSEIFFDKGPSVAGGPPGSSDQDGDRYAEIWNLVFMQYNRLADGKLIDLPNPAVDTGIGLERLTAVMQGVVSNYEIDLFVALLEAVRKITKHPELQAKSHRVIADHLRASSFLIADGVFPSNEGRGYVLRRIIRRAVRHGRKLGVTEPFLHRLVISLADEMGSTYPYLKEKRELIEAAILKEETQFGHTLAQGMNLLEQHIATNAGSTIDGATAFKLYDTYGFPLDLTRDIAREQGLNIDEAGFLKLMQQQKDAARKVNKFSGTANAVAIDIPTSFLGYKEATCSSKVVAIIVDGAKVEQIDSGTAGHIVLDQTTFYAESGGQVGDTGVIKTDTAEFTVDDTQKVALSYWHFGTIKSGSMRLGDTVEATIDTVKRQAIRLNHSATHLLHATLRAILGKHVEQKGSIVEPSKLRFDFSHSEPVTQIQLAKVETMVNTLIRDNTAIETENMSLTAAKDKGAMALFDTKYTDSVRVLSMGAGFSIELCGGTHANRTGDIGVFKIINETSVASGVRRIEAITGTAALDDYLACKTLLDTCAQSLKTTVANLPTRLEQSLGKIKQLEKELHTASKAAALSGGDLLDSAQKVGSVLVLSQELALGDPASLRETLDGLKNRCNNLVAILAVKSQDKIQIVGGVSKSIAGKLPANELVAMVAKQIDGRGGGRPEMAQGGGTNLSKLSEALDSVWQWVQQRI